MLNIKVCVYNLPRKRTEKITFIDEDSLIGIFRIHIVIDSLLLLISYFAFRIREI